MPFRSEHWPGTRQQASLWPSAKDHSRHRCTGPVVGEALQVPTLNQGCSCRRVEVGSCEPPGPGWGEVRAQWGSVAQRDAGQSGRGLWECRTPSLPPEPAAVEGVLSDSSVYRWPWSQREAALPPGGSSRQTVVHGLKRPSSQPLWAASPAPGRRGARTGYLLPLSLPSHNGEGEPSAPVPGETARPSPSSGTSMGVRLMSEGQVCPEVTKVGGSQK